MNSAPPASILPRRTHLNPETGTIDIFATRWRPALALIPILLLSASVVADEPWRIDDAWGTPDWLTVSGSYRMRYEWLDNTFRVLDPGTDDLLLSRVLLDAVARPTDNLRVGVELQDSRAWFSDARTPLGTDDVNALEPLQVYVGIRGNGWFRPDDSVDVVLGRFTLGLGSNRFTGVQIYRNTRNAFSGAKATWARPDGPRVQAFITNPVIRLPNQLDRDGMADNEIRLDKAPSSIFWGAFVDRLQMGGADAEFYLFGIDDSDHRDLPTRNRNFLTVGMRLLGTAQGWSWEIEPVIQFGTSRLTALPSDTTDRDHRAWYVHARASHPLPGRWNPVLQFRYDYATGDHRLDDNQIERFDTLYGPLRFDFGPTGIYNAIGRTNTNAPGVYLRMTPSNATNWMIGYRAAWLASRRDRFGNTGVVDPAGASGRFAGHQVETRFRWEIIPSNLRFEVGGAVLFKGEFLEDAPTAPPTGDTIYIYSSLLTWF